MSISGFLKNMFNTAPLIRSEKVLKLAMAGRTSELLEAIENERRGHTQSGRSANGQITVTRVGAPQIQKQAQ
jgi:hypothetical protein